MVIGPIPTQPFARIRAVMASRAVTRVMRSLGYLLIFAGFLLALWGAILLGIWLVVGGWLLTRAARMSYNTGRMTSLLDGFSARDAMDAAPAGVPPSLSLETLWQEDSRQRGGSGVYPVRRGDALLGIVDVLDADRVPRAAWATTRVEGVMKPLAALPSVAPDTDLVEVVARLEQSRREAIAVVDPEAPDVLAGLATRERVHQLMRSREDARSRERERQHAAKHGWRR
jgi:CBS domain-containing protein